MEVGSDVVNYVESPIYRVEKVMSPDARLLPALNPTFPLKPDFALWMCPRGTGGAHCMELPGRPWTVVREGCEGV